MLGLYRGDHSHARSQGQERAVVLVGLDHVDVAFADARVASPCRDSTADQSGRVTARPLDRHGRQRRRRRLAVCAGDGDQVTLNIIDQLSQRFAAFDHRYPPLTRLQQLRVIRRSRRSVDHSRWPDDLRRVVTDVDGHSLPGQVLGRLAGFAIASRHLSTPRLHQ